MSVYTEMLAAQRPKERAKVVQGTIVNDVSSDEDELYVTIDAFDGGAVTWGPCPWSPSTSLPKRGDACLVLLDETQQPWVISLAPVAGAGSGGVSEILSGEWNWTTTAGVLARQVRLDTGGWSTATQVWIAKTNAANNDTTNILLKIEPGDQLYLQDRLDASKWGRYEVTAGGTDQGVYFSFPVTYLESAGSIPANGRGTYVALSVPAVPGPEGPEGPMGPQGPQGETGATGPQGLTGAQGPQGLIGNTGLQGPQGVKGDTGNTGAQGIQGPIGNTGSQGVPGTPGETWFTGTGAPAGATGIVGDWYLNSTNGDYYEKTGASTWTLRGNLKGPQGTQGIQGTQGPIGNTGLQGPIGNTGVQGPQGVKGDTGDTGPAGPTGATGAQGPQGEQGELGPIGTVYDTDQIGTVKAFVGKVVPTNWMLADGRVLPRADYSQLADALGVASGAGTFPIPDLTNRFLYGATDPNAQLGTGGFATVPLDPAHMPRHRHVVNSHAHETYNESGVLKSSYVDADHTHDVSSSGATTSDSGNHVHTVGANSVATRQGGSAGNILTGMADLGGGNSVVNANWGGNHGHNVSVSGTTGGVKANHRHNLVAQSPGTDWKGGNGAQSDGPGTGHENMPPYVLVAFIVKVTGVQVDSGGALVGATGAKGDDGIDWKVYEQPTTPPAGEIGELWIDTDELPLAVPQIPLVTALPATPLDGQEVYFQSAGMATDNIVWHLRYRAASTDASKWEFLGGAPLYDTIDTDETTTTTGAWLNLATDGPKVTVPLAGDYIFDGYADCYHSAVAQVVCGVANGDAGANFPFGTCILALANNAQGVGFFGRNQNAAAGTVYKLRYYSYTAGTAHWRYRRLRVTPIRVGP